jgi:hypothetical protein
VTIIDWTLPPQRGGVHGLQDKIAGPGATKAEVALQIILPILAVLAAYFYVQKTSLDWPWWKVTLFCALAFDMIGGIVTNSTSSAKRWYHRDGQGKKQHLTFVGVHTIHVALVALVFRNFDALYFGALSGYLLLAAVIVVSTPLYLQRTMAFSLFSVGLLLESYGWAAPFEIAWFTPLLLLKLLVAHLPREEPYRP